MNKFYDLSGIWKFRPDTEKCGIQKGYENAAFDDEITLPNTVSAAQKLPANDSLAYTGYLTDPRESEGYMWFSKVCTLDRPLEKGEKAVLLLERTRLTTVWIDGVKGDTLDSLCTSHRHDITSLVGDKTRFTVTVMVSNTGYPVPGGHLTSPDTQTNWNGILGNIGIEIIEKIHLEKVRIFPNIAEKSVTVNAVLKGSDSAELTAFAEGNGQKFPEKTVPVSGENISFTYEMGDEAKLWDEFSPVVYTLNIRCGGDVTRTVFGLREFSQTNDGKTGFFTANGKRVHLRGKHDGMIFPLTAYAPTDLDSWLKVMKTAKAYRINHYRFHTCCPPEAAFAAADMLGIYMEPELPFWGTIADEEDDGQRYLTAEGFRILDEFGSHPSFVMFSMGNELWGSKERLNAILGGYRAYDSTKLYTQGSNNYQFIPCVLDNDDFFVGVRFSHDRLFRGSYAMCDAPQGHIQTDKPNSVHDYDEIIHPKTVSSGVSEGGTIEIQYGTGVKTVSADAAEEFSTLLPVVSHEVGQYETFPDFSEIDKYTGVLKAKNFEIFRERLNEKGMLSQANDFFKASGRLAADCWREEIETALRSDHLAGFQLLDIQDFSGQGTALVGILNAFMENKGIISEEKWAEFCGEKVLLLRLPTYLFRSGDTVRASADLYDYSENGTPDDLLKITLTINGKTSVIYEKYAEAASFRGLFRLAEFTLDIPKTEKMTNAVIRLEYGEISSERTLWIFPEAKTADSKNALVTHSPEAAKKALCEGKNVLYLPKNLDDENSVQGAYCTDFWCYPMFRSISESMKKPVPVGTMGYLIDSGHPALSEFKSEFYSTPQWFDIAENSRTMILDDIPLTPIVRTVDNFERNHRLGTIFELSYGNGKLLVCTCPLDELTESISAKQLLFSLTEYVDSDSFKPEFSASEEQLDKILGGK